MEKITLVLQSLYDYADTFLYDLLKLDYIH